MREDERRQRDGEALGKTIEGAVLSEEDEVSSRVQLDLPAVHDGLAAARKALDTVNFDQATRTLTNIRATPGSRCASATCQRNAHARTSSWPSMSSKTVTPRRRVWHSSRCSGRHATQLEAQTTGKRSAELLQLALRATKLTETVDKDATDMTARIDEQLKDLPQS